MKQFESIILREVKELGDVSQKERPTVGQTVGTIAKNVAGLIIGKENIMAKVNRILKSPSIDDLFSWTWVPRKSKTYVTEPIKGDEVVINGVPGLKKYKIGNDVAQILGTIAAKKISKMKYYYEIDTVIPKDFKPEDIQLDFSLLGKGKIGKIAFIFGVEVKEYPCKVIMLEQNKWSVSIITEVNTKNIPASPGLEDAKAVAAAGKILNNFLGIKNRSELAGNLSNYLTMLSIIAQQIRDSYPKASTLERLTSLTEQLAKVDNFEELGVKGKLVLLNNKLEQTK